LDAVDIKDYSDGFCEKDLGSPKKEDIELCNKVSKHLERLSGISDDKIKHGCFYFQYWFYDQVRKKYSAGNQFNNKAVSDKFFDLVQLKIDKSSNLKPCKCYVSGTPEGWKEEKDLHDYFENYKDINCTNSDKTTCETYVRYVTYINNLFQNKEYNCCDDEDVLLPKLQKELKALEAKPAEAPKVDVGVVGPGERAGSGVVGNGKAGQGAAETGSIGNKGAETGDTGNRVAGPGDKGSKETRPGDLGGKAPGTTDLVSKAEGPGDPGSKAAGPEVQGSKEAGPEVLGSQVAGNKAEGSAGTGSEQKGPEGTEGDVAKPAPVKPAPAKPVAAKPVTTVLGGTESGEGTPEALKPAAAKPAHVKPAPAKPVAAKPALAETTQLPPAPPPPPEPKETVDEPGVPKETVDEPGVPKVAVDEEEPEETAAEGELAEEEAPEPLDGVTSVTLEDAATFSPPSIEGSGEAVHAAPYYTPDRAGDMVPLTNSEATSTLGTTHEELDSNFFRNVIMAIAVLGTIFFLFYYNRV
ncbi:VIR protein, partial [Plasmodium vivax]